MKFKRKSTYEPGKPIRRFSDIPDDDTLERIYRRDKKECLRIMEESARLYNRRTVILAIITLVLTITTILIKIIQRAQG